MKKILLLFLFSLPLYPQGLEEALNTKLNELFNADDYTGISAAVSYGDSIVWKGAEGFSNPYENIKVNPDMVFAIASITKMFTASIILRMAEENKLSLNDSIAKWIQPDEKINGAITVKQLLNHTSGINDYTTQEWVDSFKVDPAREWTPRDVLDVFVHDPLFPAGTSWSYSNTNYLLLGMIIEIVEDKSYLQVMREMLDEINLPAIYLPPAETTASEIAVPWFDMDEDGEDDNLFNYSMNGVHTSAWAAGALHSNAADLCRWAFKLFNGQVISESLFDEFTTTVDVGNFGYGLGVMKFQKDGLTLYGHSGGYIGYSSMLMIEPVKNISAVVFSNETESDMEDFCAELLETAYNQLITSVKDESTPSDFVLNQNYPNPFNPATKITFSIPEGEHVSIKIFDVLGREVKTLLNEYKEPGDHSLEFNAAGLAGGVYLYKLQSENFNAVKKMILIN